MPDEFGTWPLQYIQNAEGLYEIVAEHAGNAEASGINPVFEAERLAIMEARALAHGYQLTARPEPEPEPEPEPDNHTDPALPVVRAPKAG